MINLRDVARELNDAPVAEPTPVVTLYRRAATLRRRSLLVRAGTGALAVAAAVAIAIAVTSALHNDNGVGTTPATQPRSVSAVGWPTSFVSTRLAADGNGLIVAVSDARTGALLKTVASIPSTDGTNVTGTAITRDGHVWVTINRGPKVRSGVAGGDPAPHSCSSDVRAYDPKNGTYATVMHGRDDELVSDVQPSPTGDRIAYTHAGCATSYFNTSVQVKDLRTGRIVSIGAGLSRCHFISSVRWTADGNHLVFAYGIGNTPRYNGPQGTCSEPGPAAITVVSARRSQPGVEGSATPAASACSMSAVAATKDGYAGIEQCGSSNFVIGPVRLVRYDADLRPLGHESLGQCGDGASIGGTVRSSDLVISTYQYCSGTGEPTTRVFLSTGAGIRQLLSLPGGTTAINHITF